MSVDVIKAILAVAPCIADDAQQRAQEVAASANLSLEGVALALDRCLERSASEEDLSRFVARAKAHATSEVVLILSAQVFTAAFRAILFARACAERVVVKPSRRDPLFAELACARLGPFGVACAPALDIAQVERGMIHAYGRNETMAQIRAASRVPVLGHGSGLGVVLLDPSVRDDEIDALAHDVVVFDQRGCLSPRIVFVRGLFADVQRVAARLHSALAASRIPRGELTGDERTAAVAFSDLVVMCGGDLHRGVCHSIGTASRFDTGLLAPTGRHVLVTPLPIGDESPAISALFSLRPFVTTVGVDTRNRDAVTRDLGLQSGVRVVPLGRMQEPPLDGPVDLRQLKDAFCK
jgi:hypothetical protein